MSTLSPAITFNTPVPFIISMAVPTDIPPIILENSSLMRCMLRLFKELQFFPMASYNEASGWKPFSAISIKALKILTGSSLILSSASPTHLTILSLMSFLPLKGSTIPSVLLYAIALTVKSLLFKSSCMVSVNSNRTGVPFSSCVCSLLNVAMSTTGAISS